MKIMECSIHQFDLHIKYFVKQFIQNESTILKYGWDLGDIKDPTNRIGVQTSKDLHDDVSNILIYIYGKKESTSSTILHCHRNGLFKSKIAPSSWTFHRRCFINHLEIDSSKYVFKDFKDDKGTKICKEYEKQIYEIIKYEFEYPSKYYFFQEKTFDIDIDRCHIALPKLSFHLVDEDQVAMLINSLILRMQA